jgi:hypothetical protein
MSCCKINIRIPLSIFTACSFLLAGCTNEANDLVIFPIDSLVSEQVNYLAERGARLEKEASIQGKKSSNSYTPSDTSAWNHELNIFRQLNVINKPTNKTLYIVDDGLFDPRSNLTVKAISSIKNLPVRYIRIFYQDAIEKPRKIEALYIDENLLSKTGRILTMEFQQINNRPILTAYSVEGGQKIIFGDSVAYLINGKIVID